MVLPPITSFGYFSRLLVVSDRIGGEARIVFSPDAYFNPRLALQPIIYYAWGALLLIFILACLCGKFKGFKKKWMTYTSPILQIILQDGSCTTKQRHTTPPHCT